MMTRSHVLVALLVFPLVSRGAEPDRRAIDPNNPTQGRFSDEWAVVYLNDNKIGYAHSTMTRAGELINTKTSMKMDLGRIQQPMTITSEETTTETVGGVPVSFASIMKMAATKIATRGTIKDGKVTVVKSQFGMDQTQTHDFPSGALMTWGMFRESLVRGFKPGSEYEVHVYAPQFRLDGAVSTTTKVADWEEFEHQGKRYRGQKVIVAMASPIGSMEIISWVDETGQPIKAKIPFPGMGDMVLMTTDQQTALADFVPPELFLTTVVKAKRKIDAKDARSIRYRVTVRTAEAELGDFPSTGMQSVTDRSGRSVELVVARQTHKPISTGKVGKPAIDMSEYLEGNLMINVKDPQLVKLARGAKDGETEPFALADKLRRFVSDYVKTKSLNVGFATASEVSRTREGDCSEHAILLAALGRVLGLPARVVTGVVYVPQLAGQSDVFGYHMWTQFMIDGRWIDFDAALRESNCSPTRIAFATSSLRDSGLTELSLPLLSMIGAIDIDILEIEGGYNPKD